MQDNRIFNNFGLEVHYENKDMLRKCSSECNIPGRIETSGRADDVYVWGAENEGFSSYSTDALNALVRTIPPVIEGRTNEHFPDMLDWDHNAIVAEYAASYIGLHHHDKETLLLVASALLQGVVDPAERLEHETAVLVSKRAWCEGILSGIRELCDIIVEAESRLARHPRMTYLLSNLETAHDRYNVEQNTGRWQSE